MCLDSIEIPTRLNEHHAHFVLVSLHTLAFIRLYLFLFVLVGDLLSWFLKNRSQNRFYVLPSLIYCTLLKSTTILFDEPRPQPRPKNGLLLPRIPLIKQPRNEPAQRVVRSSGFFGASSLAGSVVPFGVKETMHGLSSKNLLAP